MLESLCLDFQLWFYFPVNFMEVEFILSADMQGVELYKLLMHFHVGSCEANESLWEVNWP